MLALSFTMYADQGTNGCRRCCPRSYVSCVSSAAAAYIFEEVLLEAQATGKALHDHLHHLMTLEHEVQHLLPACQDCIRYTLNVCDALKHGFTIGVV